MDGAEWRAELRRQRTALFHDLIQPGERVWDTAAGWVEAGLGRPEPGWGEGPDGELVVTDRAIYFADRHGRLVFPYMDIVDRRVKKQGRFGARRGMAFLDLTVGDGSSARIGCGFMFLESCSALLSAYTCAPRKRAARNPAGWTAWSR